MKLRKKTLLILTGSLLLTLAAGVLVASTVFLDSYRKLEYQDIQSDAARFNQALEFEISRLNALTYDWAAWDDSYFFMQNKNPAYISSNLMDDTLFTLELDFMVFFTASHDIHFFNSIALKDSSSPITQEDLANFFSSNQYLLSPNTDFDPVAGIAKINGQPVLIASHPILTSQEEGPPLGRLVFGRILSGHLLEHLQLMTGEEISISSIENGGEITKKFDSKHLVTSGEMLVSTIADERISASVPIRDTRQRVAFIMTVQKPREIFREGRASVLRLVSALTLAGIFGGGMMMLILEKWVISKLSTLDTRLQAVRDQGYTGQTLAIAGNDEISSLSRQIEGALKELARAHADANHHLEFQRLLVKLSTNLINLPLSEIDPQIHTAIKTIGQMAGADRSYVFLRREKEPLVVDNTHEWCRRGVQPMKAMLQGLEESSLPWWFSRLRKGKNISIERVAELSDEAAAERELLLSQSIRSLAVVPLQAGGQLIGFLGFDAVRKEKKFSERSLALLGIVGGMIANAVDRQYKESRLVNNQHVQFQLNNITRVSIEKENLRITAIALSEVLTGLIQSEKCILILFDENDRVEEFDTGKQRNRRRSNHQGWEDLLANLGESIQIVDKGQGKNLAAILGHKEIQSAILIPLISEHEVIGAAILADPYHREYTREEIEVCQQASPQITLAIMRVKALEAARRRSEELNALRATIADITSELELNKLLRTILVRAVRLANADGGEICVFDEARQALVVVASHNLDKDYAGTWMPIGEGAGGRAVQLKRTFIVEDYATWPGRMEAYEGAKFHATIVTPLMIGERILGTISILHFSPDRQFSKEDQHILSLFAHHAAIAMENAMLFEKVHELARTDTVTGLLNRRALRDIGEYEVARARRLDHSIAVAMIDLDDFKAINDTYTHMVGDEVLREVARLCRENIRSIDIISRYGGDEFALIMPATNKVSALRVCRRLQKVLGNYPIPVNGQTFIARFSIGLTVHAHNPPALDELFAQADKAMYEAKTGGKNCIYVYKPGKTSGVK